MILQAMRTALEALNAHRMRTTLTLLGILIGIAAVMMTVGLTQGASSSMSEQMGSLGTKLLYVTPGSTSSGGIRGMSATTSSLNDDDVALLSDKNIAPDIDSVAATYSGSYGALRSSTTTWYASISGVTANYLDVLGTELESGRMFTQGEIDASASVVVLDSSTAEQLFSDTSQAVGQTISIGGQSFTVIGVQKDSGTSGMTMSSSSSVLVPLSTARERFGTGGTSLSMIYMLATSTDTLSAAKQEAENAMSATHRTSVEEPDFSIASMSSIVDMYNTVMMMFSLLLGGIASISLLVGAIGVMNIMLVSVSERVREIGLRKALGATPGNIRIQFLIEAAMVGLAGGILGVLVGLGGSALIQWAISTFGGYDLPVIVSWDATAIALAVSMTIGIIAGVYPASRAAKLAPIDALRSE
ncbi:MAG: ABC transporter permease [Propionibacteriaceae bacterium]|jgi:putative ABC transport system permease protein|nr:ABC transporter permease [Propionibacteriaceae bacterium]